MKNEDNPTPSTPGSSETDLLDPVHISVVLDRSGSMASIADDMVGGFNTFLDEQRGHSGGGRITLIQFDSQNPFEILIDGVDLADAVALDPAQYRPRGSTPLNDAVGRMIARVDRSILSRVSEGKPVDQIVLIVTDGLENASQEFDHRTVARLIEERRGWGWVFAFLGVDDETTFSEGAVLRVPQGNIDTWEKTARGSREVFERLSRSTSSYRSSTPEEKLLKKEEFLQKGEAPR